MEESKGFTGGAYGATIPDSYTHEDFSRDLELAAPLVICMAVEDEYKDFAEVLLNFLMKNEIVVDAFSRATTYADRNQIDQLW